MKKALVVSLYTLVFWGVLPAALLFASFSLDRALRLQKMAAAPAAGMIVVGSSASLLLLAMIQYVRAAGELPVSAYPPRAIIRQGMFAVWRHPIYLTSLGSWLGVALLLGSPALLAIVLPGFAALVLAYGGIEERGLLKRFGRDYLAHREQTGLVFPRFHQAFKPLFFLAAKLFFPIEARNRQNIPGQAPFFVVASHRSYLDAFIIAFLLPYKVHNVTTYEAFRNPVSRRLCRWLGCIPVKRYANDARAVRAMMKTLAQGGVIGVFPEGERSFTGEMLAFKPQVVRLLAKCRDYPILPVALSGNFLFWPRWAARPRRCPITVDFKPLMRITPEQTAAQIAGALIAAITPDDAGKSVASARRALHVERVLYRCPECRSFDALKTRGCDIFCIACGARRRLDPAYQVVSPSGIRRTIADLYGAIRITETDMPAAGSGGMIARSGPARIAAEKGARLVPAGEGRLAVFGDRIVIEPAKDGGEAALEIPFAALAGVTIEGAGKLQLYDGRHLIQAVFSGESAKKWQDYITLALAMAAGSRAASG